MARNTTSRSIGIAIIQIHAAATRTTIDMAMRMTSVRALDALDLAIADPSFSMTRIRLRIYRVSFSTQFSLLLNVQCDNLDE